MSQILGAFGLLDFTMLWSGLMHILKLKNCLFLEFSKFFSGCGKLQILNPWLQGSAFILFSEKYILCWHKKFQQFTT